MTDVERREHAITHVGGERHRAVARERAVDRRRDVQRRDRCVVRRERMLGPRHERPHETRCDAGTVVERREQALHERRKRHVGVAVVADADRAIVCQYGAPRRDRLRGDAEVRVRGGDADQQQAVGVLDQPRDLWVAGRAEVRPHQRRFTAGQQAMTHEGGHDRDAELATQRRDVGLEPEPSHLHA